MTHKQTITVWMTIPVTQGGLIPFKLAEPSPSSSSHEQWGLNTKEAVTVAHIMDCPTITVHARKC